jgi:putative Holliday junction resolvase
MPDTPDTRRPETVIAFDFGTSRIGVAVGQSVTGSAGPAGVVANGARGPDWGRIEALLAEWRPARLVVGLPLHADGSPSALSAAATAFAAELERRYGLPVETMDERWSSLEARERLARSRREGRSGRIRRPLVDAAAAVLIAERWLARHGMPGDGSPPPPDCG